MSRSGGTLLYQLLKLLVEMRDIGLGVGFPMNTNYDVEPHYEFLVLKTERYYDDYADAIKSGAALAVGTWRDPRDVAASLLRFYCNRECFRKSEFDANDKLIREATVEEVDVEQVWTEYALPALRDAIDWFSSWEALDPYLSCYESIHPNHWTTFLRGIGIQMNLDITPKEARWLFSALTIGKNLKRQQEMTQWISPSTMMTRSHISENLGRKGTYAKWLNDDKLAQVKEIAGEWMSLHAYRWAK